MGFPVGTNGKEPACQHRRLRDEGSIPRLGRCPGRGHATNSSIFAWRIPWTEEPGRLQSMGSQRVRHNSASEKQQRNVYFRKASFSAANACMHAKSLQLCPTLCSPMDCNLPGSSVHGILQARILEWVTMPSSRGSSPPSDQICNSCTANVFLAD